MLLLVLIVSTITKKITSIFFILLGFIPLLFSLYVTIQKENIFKRMKEKMEKHTLQTIILSENDVIWMDDHEIWVNDQMFDIRTKKLENGLYTFTGMYDDEETKLVAKERNDGARQKNESSKLAQVFQCLLTMYCEQNNSIISFYQSYRFFSQQGDEIVSLFSPILTPPPRKDCQTGKSFY
jgi:hypothetical protein